jgi:hypothetical protein
MPFLDKLAALCIQICAIILFVLLPPPILLNNQSPLKKVHGLIAYYVFFGVVLGVIIGKWGFVFCMLCCSNILLLCHLAIWQQRMVIVADVT